MPVKKIWIWGLLNVFITSFFLPCYGQSSTRFKLKQWSITKEEGIVTSTNFCLKPVIIGGAAAGVSFSNRFILKGGTLITSGEDSNLFRAIHPDRFSLQQNYPNPFNPATTIQYSLSKASEVSIKIFNNLGQEVRTLIHEFQSSGNYQLHWDGKNNAGQPLPGGNYYCQIIADGFKEVRKMLLLK